MKLLLTQLVLLLLLGVSAAYAQTRSVIKGNLKEDSSRKNIEGATITIVMANDSSFVKAVSTDREGNFSFVNINKGRYKILFPSQGYQKTYSPIITVEELNIDLGTMFLANEVKSLREILVVRKKPFIERKIDKTVMNVDASILSAGATAMEILEASPGISVDNEGNISLKGKSGVHVMIDGKPAYLSGPQLADLLKALPASGLEQIEIITNPSSQFDAAGNAGIINIKTKKNKIKGFNTNVSTGYSQNIAFNHNHSLLMNYRNGKLNLFGSYTFSDRTEYRDLSILRNFKNITTQEIETIFDQQSSLKKNSVFQNPKLGVDFYATKNTTLGFVLNTSFADFKSTDDNTSFIQNPFGITDSSLNAVSHIKGNFKNSNLNFNFRHRFNSTAKELTADVDYINFNQADLQVFDNYYYNSDMSIRKPNNKLRGSLPAQVKVYSVKADYAHPLKKNARFETGIKSSYVATDNNAEYDNLKNSSWETDYGKTNHFRYNEYINAAYLNYNKQLKKWAIQAGLRAENTIASGQQLGNQVNPDSSFRRSYTNIFPTVFILYNADSNNTLSANFGRRISRPAYQTLNPFYYFLDDYTYRIGNTQLAPQYSNSIEISYGYKGFVTATLNYSKTTDLFLEVFKQRTSERIFIITHDNIASKRDIGISISATIPVNKIWSTNIYTNIVNNKFSGIINGKSLDVNGTFFSGNVSNQVKLNSGWSAELNGWYRSKGIDGQVISEPMWSVSTGLQKEILKKKGVLKLSLRDIFNSQKFKGSVQYDDIDAKIINNNFQRTATLTFTFRLGKLLNTQKPKNNSAADDEQNRIRKG